MATSGAREIKRLIKTIDDAVDKFADAMPGIQKTMLEQVQVLLKDLDLDADGNIRNTVANLKLVQRLQAKLQKIVLSPKYSKEVRAFASAFVDANKIQVSYFKQLETGYKQSAALDEYRKQTIDATIRSLAGAGVEAAVIEKTIDLIRNNVASGAPFSQLNKEMRDFLTEAGGNVGALRSYSSQITTDGLNQFTANIHEETARDLGLVWYQYVGSLVKDSRAFCVSLLKKRWVHQSELGKVASGNFLPKPKNLQGMIPGTNAANFQTNRGGFNCRHQLIPVAAESVPRNLRRRFE